MRYPLLQLRRCGGDRVVERRIKSWWSKVSIAAEVLRCDREQSEAISSPLARIISRPGHHEQVVVEPALAHAHRDLEKASAGFRASDTCSDRSIANLRPYFLQYASERSTGYFSPRSTSFKLLRAPQEKMRSNTGSSFLFLILPRKYSSCSFSLMPMV